MRGWVAVVAAVLLAGCSGTTAGSDAVVATAYEGSSVPFDSLEAFVTERPVIATGTVTGVSDTAYEVPVDPDAEGNAPGEGPEVYGSVSFRLDTVIKGDVAPGATLTIVFLSGKWNTTAKRGPRIGYLHDGLAGVQRADSRLKSPSELAGITFAVFAAPKPATVPVKAAGLYVAGIATVDPRGQLTFAGPSPFVSTAGTAVTLDAVKAAVS